MSMIEGWLLDVHQNASGTGMIAWVIDEQGMPHACSVDWNPVIHVHAPLRELDRLEHWLMQPELRQRFGIERMDSTRARLDLESERGVDVLEIEVGRHSQVRALAEHIEARGDFHRYKLYSVDAHVAQRFLNEHACIPFQRVQWSNADGRLEPLTVAASLDTFPPFHVAKLEMEFAAESGHAVVGRCRGLHSSRNGPRAGFLSATDNTLLRV